ncbi:hypothetical protein [Nocardioides sp. zg-DK7169]|uniref:hypothetical protein n=1 Tax=Nocardioides sp. zg-DK7169 TaxID=2736600 RepID=UPI001552C208|nr:hypothetical protein [Nocardioides sp. zg-DK7169]NPC97743.1 hypothetical protein [Nocardioides sp. zg-DK7169]
MPEQSEHQSDRRAEAAFREAFARRADAYDPLPLDLSAPQPRATRRTTWWWPAVAAVLVLVVSGALLLGRGDGTVAPPAAVDPAGAADDAGEPGAAEPGHAWVTWRDVAVQVPQEWADNDGRSELGPDWCGAHDADAAAGGARPHVAREGLDRVVFAIGCQPPEEGRPATFGAAPTERWAPHVSFETASREVVDGTASYAGWTIVTRTLGDVQVRVWTPDDDADLAARVAGSARRVATDQNGCPTESVVQYRGWSSPDPVDLAALRDVDSAAVCRYLPSRPATPGLLASRSLDRNEAEDLVAALLDAPGAEAGQRSSCAADDLVLVRIRHADGVAELHAALSCVRGALSDGTRVYDMTREVCHGLLDGAVSLNVVPGRLFAVCRD